jgi:integrase
MNLAKTTDRKKLAPRRDPYWNRLQKGCYLGFRKMTADADGTWLARWYSESDSKQHYKALGDFSEHPVDARHDLAMAAARDWFTHLGRGGSTAPVTVQEACNRYVEHLKANKGEKAAADAQARFAAYVCDQKALSGTDITKLVPAHLSQWRRELAQRPTSSGPNRGHRRSDSSLNRDMTCLRAALNLAYREGATTTDAAWREKLRPIKAADKRRKDYLTPQQRKLLISKAAPDLADFLRGLALLPIRPGALAALTVGDFDKRLKTIRIGHDKTGDARSIALPDRTASLFSALTQDKLPSAPLFMRSNGTAWNKDAWKKPVREAVKRAALPTSITAYTMRHSVITDLVHSGLDTLTVAQLSGTSVVMIERHYGHLTQAHAKKALARLHL